jgi:nitrate/nitrite-specific signal transduction histidine kinase
MRQGDSVMARTLDTEVLQEQLDTYLTLEGRQWLADFLHDYLSPHVTNASIQAEIVLRAWERNPEMALEEMRALKEQLGKASKFLVELIREATPPAQG